MGDLANKTRCKHCDFAKVKKKVFFKYRIATEHPFTNERNNNVTNETTPNLSMTIPERMVRKLIEVAKANTTKATSIETGGIVVGSSKEQISEHIIPKQIGK